MGHGIYADSIREEIEISLAIYETIQQALAWCFTSFEVKGWSEESRTS